MRLYHLGNTLQGINEVLAGEFRIRCQLTIIVGVVNALLPLDKEAIDGTIKQILGTALRLNHNRKAINLTDFVVFPLGACFLVDLLQACSNNFDVRIILHTFNLEFINGFALCITFHTLPKASQVRLSLLNLVRMERYGTLYFR